MAKIFVISSGKGGVGKTTTAINLGAAINKFGEDVVVVDANLTTPNVGLHFGAPIVPVTLNHVLRDEAEIHEAIYQHESGTKIIPSDLSIKELSIIRLDKIKNMINKLKNYSNYIVVDSPAGLGEDSLSVLDVADEIIIVTNPEVPAITDALKTIKVAEEQGKRVKGVIINRVKMRDSEMTLANMRDMLETPVIALIPEDKNMQIALSRKDAIVHTHPRSKASEAYKEAAGRLIGKNYKANYKLWDRLKRNLGFGF